MKTNQQFSLKQCVAVLFVFGLLLSRNFGLWLNFVCSEKNVAPLRDSIVLLDLVVMALVKLDIAGVHVAENSFVDWGKRREVRHERDRFPGVASNFEPVYVGRKHHDLETIRFDVKSIHD